MAKGTDWTWRSQVLGERLKQTDNPLILNKRKTVSNVAQTNDKEAILGKDLLFKVKAKNLQVHAKGFV